MRVTVSTPIPKTDETGIPAEQGADGTDHEGPRVEGLRRRFWGDSINGRGADERRTVRQEKSKPLLEDMHAWLLRERETLSRASEVLKPINYMLRRWERLRPLPRRWQDLLDQQLC